MKPFLKWVGGKTQILDKLLSEFPIEMNNYHEFCLGGGSVLFGLLQYINENKIQLKGKIYAYDINEELINVYKNFQTFDEDKYFIADLFSEVIAPNEKHYDYLEDYKLTWLDDVPLVNTMILKQIKQVKETQEEFKVTKLYKDEDDKDYAKNLFRKTVLNEVELSKQYIDKTPNWDTDRIAEIDTIILKMAICEFLKFPSIPVKVTINEYLEIAKEYSTPKSSIFINGILDNLIKDLKNENILVKTGRGLL